MQKMTGETPEVRSDIRRRKRKGRKRRKRRKTRKRRKGRKGRKRREKKKEKKDHGKSWNIMEHHGSSSWN